MEILREVARHKTLRRALLEYLYVRYRQNPVGMVEPADLLEHIPTDKDLLAFNMHYLADHGWVELLRGYAPPLFTAARITATGIDLVENPGRFNRILPPSRSEQEDSPEGALPVIVDTLCEESLYAQVDAEQRDTLDMDLAYLRAELARSSARRRPELIYSIINAMATVRNMDPQALPSLEKLRELLRLAGIEPPA
ncbi:MAG TPA: hypothetical protein PLO53_04970 [Candidatus Hydrogenedentes bacterium]|nr:hypothetical protein [Candidatus Hydrogenedentota bacterium]